jgi:tetratricopeptide (TPR) repeat protein
MKKTLLALFVSVMTLAAYAQPDVVNAKLSFDDGDFASAKESIDKAITNEKAAAKEKTWRYRGNIYMQVALDSAMFLNNPDALDEAYKAYTKAMQLDKRGSYVSENTVAIQSVMGQSMNFGINYYNSADFGNAGKYFMFGNDISTQEYDSVHTQAVYNAALSFEKAEMYDQAINAYEICVKAKYQTPEVFLFIANIHRKNDDEESAVKVIQDARVDYPRNKYLIIEELNYYLQNGEYEKAKENLRLAAEQDPTNEILFFSMGSVYDNLSAQREKDGNMEESNDYQNQATEAYKKAIAIKADYFDANYNLGAMYFNDGVEKVNEANAVPPSQSKRYKALLDEAKAIFAIGLPYLEKAHEVNPEDTTTIRSLRDIYARLGDDENTLKMSALLK